MGHRVALYEKNEDYIEHRTSSCAETFNMDYDDLVNEFIRTKFPNIVMLTIFDDEEISLIKPW